MRPHTFCLVTLALLATAATAPAEPPRDVAPGLARPSLAAQANQTLDALALELPATARANVLGAYVAVDPDESDPYAMASCDDDGDPVVVLSAAMLEVIARVADAMSGDASEERLAAWSTTLARAPKGARLAPPPPGFYDGPHDPARAAAARDEALRGVVGGELARLARGHLACAHPTPQREAGDAQWTAAERAFAFELAPRLYDARHQADAEPLAAAWRGETWRALARALDDARPGVTTWTRLRPVPKPL